MRKKLPVCSLNRSLLGDINLLQGVSVLADTDIIYRVTYDSTQFSENQNNVKLSIIFYNLKYKNPIN